MDARITGPVSKDDIFDVPDSTDWLSTPLACVAPIEQALRCHVCKDFFVSPMITSCSHTFCSICIRRALATDGKCPLCRASDQELKLRGDWAMREVVDSFVKARQTMLEFARTPAHPSPLKRGPDDGSQGTERAAKRTRTSARLSKAKAAEATAAIVQDEAEVSDSESDANYEPDDGLVECPICLKRMKAELVDRHIDTTCPGSPQPQTRPPSKPQSSFGRTSSSSPHVQSPAPTPERLPSLSYSLLKDNALRKKLADLGISTAGSRLVLEKRHKEWITIWNANCDSNKPKKRHELLHDLETWERTQGPGAIMTSRSTAIGAQINSKDFDGAAWASKHEDSFRDLIAAARKTRAQAEQKAGEASDPPDTTPGPTEITAGAGDIETAHPDGYLRQRAVNGIDGTTSHAVDLTINPSSQTLPRRIQQPSDGQYIEPSNSTQGKQPRVLTNGGVMNLGPETLISSGWPGTAPP